MAKEVLRTLRRAGFAMAAALASLSAVPTAAQQPLEVQIGNYSVSLPKASYDEVNNKIIVTGDALGREMMFEADLLVPSRYSFVPKITREGVVIVYGKRELRPIRWGLFHEVPTPHAAPITPRAVAGSTAIAVSNDADVFDLTCDGRYAVVAGANSATPVAVVDLAQEKQVFALAVSNRLARAASAGDDGRTVLVVLDAPTSTTANSVRRLTLGADGTLADSGQELAFGTEYVTKVRVAPGSKVGVALVGIPTRIVSFSLPDLVVRGSVTLTGGTGNALDLSPAGDRVYARSGRRGVAPDVIEAFAFDSATGAIGQGSTLRIGNVSPFLGVVYHDPMAVSTDGTRIVAAEENAAPAPRIASFDAGTGALVDSVTGPQITQPRSVSTIRPCSVASPAGTAIEYYHAAFDHYFVTAGAEDIAKLDDGTFGGWARTGRQFKVTTAPAPGLAPVCRFFSTAFGEKSSHFYTAYATECATVKTKGDWFYEGDVFYAATPAAGGTCGAGTEPLYRLYNQGQGGAPNHRFTTDLDLRATMLGKGWIAEGEGIGVTMCVPQ